MMAANKSIRITDSQGIECTNLRVFLGDGSEEMLYTGQILLHCTIQQAYFTPPEEKKKIRSVKSGTRRIDPRRQLSKKNISPHSTPARAILTPRTTSSKITSETAGGSPGTSTGTPVTLKGKSGALSGSPATLGGSPATLGGGPATLGGSPATLGSSSLTLGNKPGTLGCSRATLGGNPATLGGSPAKPGGTAGALESSSEKAHPYINQSPLEAVDGNDSKIEVHAKDVCKDSSPKHVEPPKPIGAVRNENGDVGAKSSEKGINEERINITNGKNNEASTDCGENKAENKRVAKNNLGRSKFPFSPPKKTTNGEADSPMASGVGEGITEDILEQKEGIEKEDPVECEQKENSKTKKHTGIYGVNDDDDVMERTPKSQTIRKKLKIAEIYHSLLTAHNYCYQIQSSLVQTLLSRVKSFEDHLNESQDIKESSSDELNSLTLLLQSFVKCFDVQVGINRSLRVVLDNDCSTEDEDSEGFNVSDSECKDDLLVECRSLMNQTAFSRSLVSTHLGNPYSADLRYSCGEDRIFCVADKCFWINLPHGEGRLESLSGNLIYQGQWKNGKRWGFGKAFILSGIELSASPKQFGMYEGSWWNNLRHGNGRLVFASSGEYNGEWQYDLMSGKGHMTYPDGSSFEGEWDGNEPDGCGIFTWPNGNLECRNYNRGQVVRVVQLDDNARTASPYKNHNALRDYAILRLKYQSLYEEKAQLLGLNSRLKDSIEQQTNELMTIEDRLGHRHEENMRHLKQKTRKTFYEKKLEIEEKHQMKLKKMEQSHQNKVKELDEKVGQIQKELEETKRAVVCQICFDRVRDCILMPCTHMLYCRVCISKEKKEGRNRCPACRGAISGEVNCNINP